MSFTQLKSLLIKTYEAWDRDQAPRLGAALAYYTCLSLAPLLIILIAVAGLVFGKEAAQGQLFGQIQDMVGAEGAKAIQEMIQNASKPASGIVATGIGFLTLLFGASSVANELRNSLNIVWNRPYDANSTIKDLVKERSYSLVVVLGCGFLLLISLAVSSVLSAAGAYVGNMLPMPEVVLQALNFVLSFVVITGVFAALFKYLPEVDVEWRDVFLGAAFTSLLFGLGKFLIGLYLGKASFGSTYGAAGSLVILLVWVYYSSQIFFFGAEFTQVYASQHGSRPEGVASKVQTTPSAALAQYAKKASAGNAVLLPQPDDASAKVGSVLGSFLAISRVVTALWRR